MERNPENLTFYRRNFGSIKATKINFISGMRGIRKYTKSS